MEESPYYFTAAQITFVKDIVNELVEDPKEDIVKDSIIFVDRKFYVKYGALKPFWDISFITPAIRNNITQFIAKNNLTTESYNKFLDWAVEMVPVMFQGKAMDIYLMSNQTLYNAYVESGEQDTPILEAKKELSKKRILTATPDESK